MTRASASSNDRLQIIVAEDDDALRQMVVDYLSAPSRRGR
jgi:hypothetical protein